MSFSASYSLLSKWTQLFGFNNFAFPANRTGLKIPLASKLFAALKVCLIAVILVMNCITISIAKKANGIDSPTSLTVVLFTCCILFANLYLEMQYRHRMWSIIGGLCEIDSTVCIHTIRNQSSYSSFICNKCFFPNSPPDEEARSKVTL